MTQHVRSAIVSIRLPELVRRAENGGIRPAAYSRSQVWTSTQVLEFFDSIVHGYPIGTLVVAEQPAGQEDFLLAGQQIHASRAEDSWLLIDGLQRLSAIFGVLSADTAPRARLYDISFDPESRRLLSGVPAAALPLHIAINAQSLQNWLGEHHELSAADQDACWQVSFALSDYALPVIKLAGNQAELGGAIFSRLNTGGATLSQSEINRASRFKPIQYADLNSLRQVVGQIHFGDISTSTAALCVLAVRIRPDLAGVTPHALENPRLFFEELSQPAKHQSVRATSDALVTAVSFLQKEARIPHAKLLPHSSILAVLAGYSSFYGIPAGRAAELLKRWTWRVSLSSHPPSIDVVKYFESLSAQSAAEQLIDTVSESPAANWKPSLRAFSLRGRQGRINSLGLLSLQPHFLIARDNARASEVPLSATPVLNPWIEVSDSLFCRILPEGQPVTSIGGYILHPFAPQPQLLSAVELSDSATLAKHCIDPVSVELLQAGRFEEFLAHREPVMHATILRHVRSMARFGFRDRGSLPTISDESGPA